MISLRHLRLRSRVTAAAATTVMVFAMATDASAQQEAPAADRLPASVEILFSLQAADGSTGVTRDAGQRDSFTLELRGASPVTVFTDRPYRKAWQISPSALAQHWAAWFADSAPNAILGYRVPGSSASETIVVELSRPRYTASGRTLTFSARRDVVRNEPGSASGRAARIATPQDFTDALLFIDPATVGDSGPTTVDVTQQYDGIADFPTAPVNTVALLNALWGAALEEEEE